MGKAMKPKMNKIDIKDRRLMARFEDVISAGITQRKEISEKLGVKMWELTNFLKRNPEAQEKLRIQKREITNIAQDSLANIVRDPKHKNHYNACIYVLNNSKKEADSFLDKDDDDLDPVGGGGSMPNLKITFTSVEKE